MPPKKTVDVDQRLFIHASPRKVFEAISTARGLARWMVVRADLPGKSGAPYELEFDGGWKHRGTVHQYRPGRSIALTWAWEGLPVQGTVLTLSVRPKKGGALFQLLHSGFPRTTKWIELYGGAERNWKYCAMNLKSVLETGHDLRSRWDA